MRAAAADHWSTDRELLAELLELLSIFRADWASAHLKKNARGPDPIKVPRPGDRKGPLSPREFFTRMRGR